MLSDLLSIGQLLPIALIVVIVVCISSLAGESARPTS